MFRVSYQGRENAPIAQIPLPGFPPQGAVIGIRTQGTPSYYEVQRVVIEGHAESDPSLGTLVTSIVFGLWVKDAKMGVNPEHL